jgi:F-box interacting protein
MSANIPFEIQEQIIRKVLRVKSLIRFRSVSKQWKSLIDSSGFITDHNVNQNHPHHLLLRYDVGFDEYKYVSIVDDDSFPQHKFSTVVSPADKLVGSALMLDCSHGLVCLYGLDHSVDRKKLVVVWNPSIRKSVDIVVPYGPHAVGFGVCPKTFDAKIVIIKRSSKVNHEADVFTLRSRVWRSISMNLPRKPEFFSSDNAVVISGVIYWLVSDLITKNYNEDYYRHRIISFDLTSEEFEQVELPERLELASGLSIAKLDESLVVLHYLGDVVCDVWMMSKDGPSFTKLFTVVKVRPYNIIGFRKNGQPIVDQVRKGGGYHVKRELKVYEHDSKHTNGLGIYGLDFGMASYTESLLLLNHSDSIIHSHT